MLPQKGIDGFDKELAWKYMRQNAFVHNDDLKSYRSGKGRRALDTYLKYNYLPMEEKVPDAFHKEEQGVQDIRVCLRRFDPWIVC